MLQIKPPADKSFLTFYHQEEITQGGRKVTSLMLQEKQHKKICLQEPLSLSLWVQHSPPHDAANFTC